MDVEMPPFCKSLVEVAVVQIDGRPGLFEGDFLHAFDLAV